MEDENDKDDEPNILFLELGCEQVPFYSFLIISTQKMGNPIDRLQVHIFILLKRK